MPEEISKEVNKYVSNIDKDIYTVSNIPEEVVAVIFAYVSRSPKGFRENIGTVIQEEHLGQERAAKFHEKWVLNYGHASVAEHAAVHMGVERVSRLFSSVLELSNEYLSFTEYSQRYQKPEKGDFYTPVELNSSPELKNEYIDLNNHLYDVYEGLNNKLFEYLKDTIKTPDGTDEKIHFRALEKVAFEDARYVLTMGTYTNLGMTGNARAIEDSLTKLLSSQYPEVRTRAQQMKEEVRFSVPTLVKYANENEYITHTRKAIEKVCGQIIKEDADINPTEGSSVRLLEWTGKGGSDPERSALEKMVGALLFEHSELSYGEIETKLADMDINAVLRILKSSVEKLGKFDNPLNAFKLVQYTAEFVLSEACWHQLLRHRKTDWIYKEPGIADGITIPPNIIGAGIAEELKAAIRESENLYNKLIDREHRLAASYVVTNAHNRRLIGNFDLWELYHLVNLRMSEGAQWDIKNVTGALSDEIMKYHPSLVRPALDRLE